MKKIVGIIAAVAMAASVFALGDANGELSATVRLGRPSWQNEWDNAGDANNLFNFDGTNFNMLDMRDASDAVSLSVNLGAVGGSMGHACSDSTIWFKPFGDDKLKITVGALGPSGNGLQGVPEYGGIAAWTQNNKYGGNNKGYQLESKIENFTIGAVLMNAGWGKDKYWSNAYETNVYGGYNDDSIGNIAFYFGALNKFKDLKFGAGWTKAIESVKPTLNVWATVTGGKFDSVRFEPAVTGTIDPVSFGLFVPVTLSGFGTKVAAGIDAVATADFNINDSGAVKSAWLKLAYSDILSGTIALKFQAGIGGDLTSSTGWAFRVEPTIVGSAVAVDFGPTLKGNYGGMSWDLSAKFTVGTGGSFYVVVPCGMAISV